jgi:hypothetical protein
MMDDVDIIITDHIRNHQDIVDSLEKEKLFRHVYSMNAYELDYYKGDYKAFDFRGGVTLRRCINAFQRKRIISHLINITEMYDEFWSTDVLESTNLIYDSLKNKNLNLKMVFFEEGPVSVLCDQNNQFVRNRYGNVGKPLKIIYKILKYRLIYGNYDKAYSSVLSIADWKPYFPIYSIPQLDQSDKKYLEILNRVWKYTPDDNLKNKYIFFEESFALNGIDNKDKKIVEDLCDVVGNENVIIKLHPRTRENRFKDLNVTVNNINNAPWELIALNTVDNQNILVAVSTGGLIHPQLYWGIQQNAICLVDCEDYAFPQLKKQYYRLFSKICKEKSTVALPRNYEEFKNMLLAARGDA